MNILHVRYAVEIAKTNSISKAAEKLYTTQPNLSRAISELEEDLGIVIFRRTSKGVSVTPEGEEFLQYAKKIVAQVEEVEEIYNGNRRFKQSFSVCVPRSSYISYAFADFAKSIKTDKPAEIFYKETNSMRTINNVLKEEYNLGIVRYRDAFDKYFMNMFSEKKLISELITEFSYKLLVAKNHPLTRKREIALSDLSDYIEVAHGDPYVPSLPLIDVKKAELSEFVDKRIFVFERGSQFRLLQEVPDTFMWVSPMPKDLLEKYGLTEVECSENKRTYRDVLIYRKGYTLSELDKRFIDEIGKSREKYVN